MLVTHSRYQATTKKPTSNCFFTSSFIFKDISGFILRNFCFTRETWDSEVIYVARCRDTGRAYFGMTKRKCLASLTAELPIHPEYSWTCLCQPSPPFFPRQHPSSQSLFLLGVALLPCLLVRPFFLALGEAPNPHLPHPQLVYY